LSIGAELGQYSFVQTHNYKKSEDSMGRFEPLTSDGSKNFEKGGAAEDNLSALSSFIANAHNDL